MGHDWVLDVLGDIKSYAVANGLHGLADKIDEAIRVAREELSGLDAGAAAPMPVGSTMQ